MKRTSTVAAIRCGGAIGALFGAVLLSTQAMSQGRSDDAIKILKSMSDYVAAQKTLSFSYDSSIDVVTTDMQKLQFASSGKITLNRPDKFRATRTGGYADVELVSDGKTVTIEGKNISSFAQTDAPNSIDELVDRLRDDLGVSVPGADLLLARSFEALTGDLTESAHIGRGVVDGVECEHLAFRTPDTDWQIWIAIGDKRVPKKYVITSKSVTAAPEYSLVIRDWQAGAPIAANTFNFKPSAHKKVTLESLHGIDEVPAGVAPGAKSTTGQAQGAAK